MYDERFCSSVAERTSTTGVDLLAWSLVEEPRTSYKPG